LTLDPLEIPDQVQLTSLTSPDGSLSAYGPGEKPLINLVEWRRQFRVQQVAFRLAWEVVRRWQGQQSAPDGGDDHALPAQTLFPHVASAARRFLADPAKLICKGSSEPVDILVVSKYAQTAVDHLFDALRRGTRTEQAELPRIPNGSAGRGSTRFVDFHTGKPIYPADKCHLNAMVADTEKWEQSAGFALDTHPAVARWVKNEHLGLRIPYRKNGVPASYLPDFIAVLLSGLILLIEIKGRYGDDADLKAKAAQRWVEAVNRAGGFGTWQYWVVTDPPALMKLLEEVSGAPRPAVSLT
jgi:type III restriction enzyme